MSTEPRDREGYPLASEPGALARGAHLGRFVVLRHLGAGRMGTVVSAYDPSLDRNVAIKVLRPDKMGAKEPSRGKERLVEAGYALIEFSHPNVVPVFEVGVIGDSVFIAMEQVQAQPLTAWLRERRRSWRDTVALMIQAGEGLAAAHRTGIVHRDFKPENVLVGTDGTVRVTDFGLVSSEGAVADPESMHTEGGTAYPLSTSISVDGELIGTPRYMAPEQHKQERADARADQFAFCATLYEALYGQHPFAGETYWELASNVMRGEVREAEAEEHVPTWLWWAVRRGLNADPEDRFPYMDSLLRELRTGIEHVPAFGAEATEKLAAVWDDVVKQKVEEAFLDSGRPYAKDTYARIERVLDQYAEEWVAVRAEVCESTHLMHEQTEEMLDLQLHCLDRRLGELATLTGLFADEPDGEVVDHAIEMTMALAPARACRDIDALTAVVPPPEDARLRERVEYLRMRLDHAELRQRAGKHRAGLRIAEEAAIETESLGYAPVRAEALLLLGILLNDSGASRAAESTFHDALDAAARAKDDVCIARVWGHLVRTVGCRLERPQEALAMRRIAEIAVIRAGDTLVKSQVLSDLAAVFAVYGELDKARRCYEQAITVKRAVLGNDHPDIARWYGSLGSVLHREGHLEKSRRCLDAARAIFERRLGRKHPDVAKTCFRLAELAKELGNNDEALELCERALFIVEGAAGEQHPDLPDYLRCLGEIWLAKQDTVKAREPLERALSLRGERDDVECARIRFCLARALWDSEQDQRRAVELAKRALGAYSEAGESTEKERAAVGGWLRDRGIGT